MSNLVIGHPQVTFHEPLVELSEEPSPPFPWENDRLPDQEARAGSHGEMRPPMLPMAGHMVEGKGREIQDTSFLRQLRRQMMRALIGAFPLHHGGKDVDGIGAVRISHTIPTSDQTLLEPEDREGKDEQDASKGSEKDIDDLDQRLHGFHSRYR